MKVIGITAMFGIALTVLTACGPLNEGNATASAARGSFERFTDRFGGANDSASVDSPEGSQQPTITRAAIENFGVPLLRISVISREASANLYFAAENGSKVTWVSDEAFTFTFDDGLVVGTRGLGDDLMGSDVDAAKRSLNGGGSHIRTLDFLNSLSQIERHSYQCQTVQMGRDTITIYERNYATTIYDETCTGENGDFKNTYWRDANGIIWQSRQWISTGVGYIGYQRL